MTSVLLHSNEYEKFVTCCAKHGYTAKNKDWEYTGKFYNAGTQQYDYHEVCIHNTKLLTIYELFYANENC